MAVLKVVCQFDAKGLPIEKSALGSRITVRSDPWLVEIEFPAGEATAEPFSTPTAADAFDDRLPGDDQTRAFTGASVRTEEWSVQSASVFRVNVTGEAEVSHVALENEDATAARNRALAFREEALQIASVFASRVLDWLRTKAGLHALGMTGDTPRLLADAILDVSAGKRLPIGLIEWTTQVPSRDRAVDDTRIASLTEYLLTGHGGPSLAEELLADAGFLTGPLQDPKPGLGVLLAAMAVEVSVKAKLRELAGAERLPLVDVILDNPREVTVAAGQLVDRPMKATCGRSLRDENKKLFQAVGQLFEVRNAIAHRAAMPDIARARELVQAARQALDWLDSVT